MTEEQLKKRYQSLSTNELLKILDEKSDYTELAITIAKAELDTRNVSEEEIQIHEAEALEKPKNKIAVDLTSDVSLFEKIIFYFLLFPLMHLLFKRSFRSSGQLLKIGQVNYYFVSSIVMIIASALIFSFGFEDQNFNYNPLPFFTCWMLGFVLMYIIDVNYNREKQIKDLKKAYPEPEIDIDREIFLDKYR